MNAADYLVRSFSFERFVTAIEKIKIENSAQEFLIVKNDKKTFRISLAEIKFIKSIGDYVKIHTNDQALLSSNTLKILMEILPEKDFARVHNSYIISINQISYLEGNRLKISETMIPVGYAYRESISKLFKK